MRAVTFVFKREESDDSNWGQKLHIRNIFYHFQFHPDYTLFPIVFTFSCFLVNVRRISSQNALSVTEQIRAVSMAITMAMMTSQGLITWRNFSPVSQFIWTPGPYPLVDLRRFGGKGSRNAIFMNACRQYTLKFTTRCLHSSLP